MTDPTPETTPTRDEAVLSVDALAQEIRRVDGSHSLGAGALAEALMPFILASAPAPASGRGDAVGPLADERLADIRAAMSCASDNSRVQYFAGTLKALIARLDAAEAALSPAATPVSEAGGDPKGWAAVYDGQIKSCHRSRETCIADAEHYQAIHPVYLGPAWRHQED